MENLKLLESYLLEENVLVAEVIQFQPGTEKLKRKYTHGGMSRYLITVSFYVISILSLPYKTFISISSAFLEESRNKQV